MKPSNNLEKKIPPGTYWKVQLICMIVQACGFLEPPLEYSQDESRFIMTFLTIFGATEILWGFRLVLEEKTNKIINLTHQD